MLRQRPVNVLSHHGAGRLSSGAQCSSTGTELSTFQTTQITQPALIANSPDR